MSKTRDALKILRNLSQTDPEMQQMVRAASINAKVAQLIYEIRSLRLPSLATFLLGAGFVSWTIPVQAAPTLLYESLQVNGNLSTCLNLAQTAIDGAGLARQSSTPNAVNGGNAQLTATVYCQTLDSRTFRAMVMIAGAEQANLSNINYVLGSLTSAMRNPGPVISPDPNPNSAAITDAAFSQLMAALDNSWPNHLDFLAQPISQNYFTAAQAKQIVEKMGFSSEEVQVAVMLYPRLVDLNNWFIVEQALTFRSSRQELRRQISNLSNQ